jgi:hypothetical protein
MAGLLSPLFSQVQIEEAYSSVLPISGTIIIIIIIIIISSSSSSSSTESGNADAQMQTMIKERTVKF